MQTRVDELSKKDIFEMSKIEFYEAIARISEEASVTNTLFYEDAEGWSI